MLSQPPRQKRDQDPHHHRPLPQPFQEGYRVLHVLCLSDASQGLEDDDEATLGREARVKTGNVHHQKQDEPHPQRGQVQIL